MEVDLTTEAYRRWLRALQPQPIAWFLSLSELEQEALAGLGDDYVADRTAGPQDDVDAASELVRGLVERMGGAQPPATQAYPPSPLSMAGATHRRQAHEGQRQQAKDAGRRLFGREPDPVPVSTTAALRHGEFERATETSEALSDE